MFGIDVSKNNGKIDWNLVKTNVPKIDFVIIKATEGVGYIDPNLKFNATEAKKAGFNISFYHFCSLNSYDVVKDSTAEANCFLAAIAGLPNDLPLALDIERKTKGVEL